jgi:hypothetical protein
VGSVQVYGEYQRDRVGWFLGLTGLQLGVLAAGALPVVSAVYAAAWQLAFVGVLGWLVLLGVVVVPVQGRTVTGWVAAAAMSLLGRRTGWSAYRSHLSQGCSGPAEIADLPGVLSGVRVHDTAAGGGSLGVIQHIPSRVWSVTARVSHPGTVWATPAEQKVLGSGLSALLDGVCRAELVSEVQVLVRVSPDDGADRDRWLAGHRPATAPSELARQVHDGLRQHLTPAASRTETFVTLLVPERRLRRAARRSAGDLSGRAAVLADLTSEVTALLTGPLAADAVEWLTSAGLAAVCRTGFEPCSPVHVGSPVDRGTTVARGDPASQLWDTGGVWAGVGVARAVSEPRRYCHGGCVSVSSALLLPGRGAALGALGPVLAGGSVGERRCLLVGFPVLPPDLAERRTASREWAADLGDGLRDRAQVRPRARTRADNEAARAVDAKLVRGASLCRPYAVATTTVPADEPIEDAARRLDASIHQAGFTGQRLDLAHDVGFAAGCLPLGISLSTTKDGT